MMPNAVKSFAIVLFASLLACALPGCCNILIRTEGQSEFCGRKIGSPYACTPHPYYCTATVFSDAVCAPYRTVLWGKERDSAEARIADAVFTLSFPVWLVDDILELALDTAFFPVDATYALCKKDTPTTPDPPQENIQEEEEAK